MSLGQGRSLQSRRLYLQRCAQTLSSQERGVDSICLDMQLAISCLAPSVRTTRLSLGLATGAHQSAPCWHACQNTDMHLHAQTRRYVHSRLEWSSARLVDLASHTPVQPLPALAVDMGGARVAQLVGAIRLRHLAIVRFVSAPRPRMRHRPMHRAMIQGATPTGDVLQLMWCALSSLPRSQTRWGASTQKEAEERSIR